MTVRRSLGALFSAMLVVALTGCTPSVASFWRVTEQGGVSYASCDDFLIESLTVSTHGGSGTQQFELSGPEVTFAAGETLNLMYIASGWTKPEQLDMSADWTSLRLEGYVHGYQSLFTGVERSELPIGDWIQLPQSGIGVIDCELV